MKAPIQIEVVTSPVTNGEPEITTYKVHNPLAKPHWQEILLQLQGNAEAEIERWRDAALKRILPQWAYDFAHSGKPKKAQKVWEFMKKHRIEIIHPDGRSLERYIAVDGKPVSIFRIELLSE